MKLKIGLLFTIVCLVFLGTGCNVSTISHPNCGFTITLPKGWEGNFIVYDWEPKKIGYVDVHGPADSSISLGATCYHSTLYDEQSFNAKIDTLSHELMASHPDIKGPSNYSTDAGQKIAGFTFTDEFGKLNYNVYVESPNPSWVYIEIIVTSETDKWETWRQEVENIIKSIHY